MCLTIPNLYPPRPSVLTTRDLTTGTGDVVINDDGDDGMNPSLVDLGSLVLPPRTTLTVGRPVGTVASRRTLPRLREGCGQ